MQHAKRQEKKRQWKAKAKSFAQFLLVAHNKKQLKVHLQSIIKVYEKFKLLFASESFHRCYLF
jgi:hypothetical protein